MKITWDSPKHQSNLESRGLDFADLSIAFFEEALIVEAKDGRLMAIGMFNGQILSVVFKPLGTQGLSVISMRLASRRERTAYAKGQAKP